MSYFSDENQTVALVCGEQCAKDMRKAANFVFKPHKLKKSDWKMDTGYETHTVNLTMFIIILGYIFNIKH